MRQVLVTLTVPNVGAKDLIRAKATFFKLLSQEQTLTDRDRDRMEGLLNFLDACTDPIKDRVATVTGVGPEDWENGTITTGAEPE